MIMIARRYHATTGRPETSIGTGYPCLNGEIRAPEEEAASGFVGLSNEVTVLFFTF